VSCGVCTVGTTCNSNRRCQRNGFCSKIIMTLTGTRVDGWAQPRASGDVYTHAGQHQGRPYFISEDDDNGWGRRVYLYWYPGSIISALNTVGWHVGTEVGNGTHPLAFLPRIDGTIGESLYVPILHSAAWRVLNMSQYIRHTGVTTSCDLAADSVVTDFHLDPTVLVQEGTRWSDADCLQVDEADGNCVTGRPES